MQILIIVSTVCRTVEEQDCGTIYFNGHLDLYVKKCDSMNGNKHKTTAQRMPNGNKQDWGTQSKFKQYDLYVIPEALVYDIFDSIN